MSMHHVANRYSSKTLVGNWFEEQTLREHAIEEFKKRREARLAAERARLEAEPIDPSSYPDGSLLPDGSTKLSNHADGIVRFGDSVLIMSIATGGLLTYSSAQGTVVTSTENSGPVPVNTFKIVPAETDKKSGEVCKVGKPLLYGSVFRLQLCPANFRPDAPPMYLESVPISLTTSLRHKEQTVSCSTDPSADTLWRIEIRDVNTRFESTGTPVKAEHDIIITHVPTGQSLYSAIATTTTGRPIDGAVHKVSVHTAGTLGRKQNLELESIGRAFPDVERFTPPETNGWTILLGSPHN